MPRSDRQPRAISRGPNPSGRYGSGPVLGKGFERFVASNVAARKAYEASHPLLPDWIVEVLCSGVTMIADAETGNAMLQMVVSATSAEEAEDAVRSKFIGKGWTVEDCQCLRQALYGVGKNRVLTVEYQFSEYF